MSENSYSKDARFVYANTFGINMGHQELQLALGIQRSPGTEDASMEVQSTVVLTLSSAKFLSIMLERLLRGFEVATGNTIPLDESRLKKVDDAISGANKKMQIHDKYAKNEAGASSFGEVTAKNARAKRLKSKG